jgi:hypothetical protein
MTSASVLQIAQSMVRIHGYKRGLELAGDYVEALAKTGNIEEVLHWEAVEGLIKRLHAERLNPTVNPAG